LTDEELATTSMALEATRHAVLGMREKDWKTKVVFSGEALPPSIRLLRQLAGAELPAELRRKLLGLKRRLQTLPKRASSGHILGTIARGFPKAAIVSPPYSQEGKLLSSLVLPNPEFRGPVKFALLEAFRTQKELALVAELAFDLVDLRPYDLQPDVFAKAAARPGKAGSEIANLVLYLGPVSGARPVPAGGQPGEARSGQARDGRQRFPTLGAGLPAGLRCDVAQEPGIAPPQIAHAASESKAVFSGSTEMWTCLECGLVPL
jgi:hypothetical protein